MAVPPVPTAQKHGGVPPEPQPNRKPVPRCGWAVGPDVPDFQWAPASVVPTIVPAAPTATPSVVLTMAMPNRGCVVPLAWSCQLAVAAWAAGANAVDAMTSAAAIP